MIIFKAPIISTIFIAVIALLAWRVGEWRYQSQLRVLDQEERELTLQLEALKAECAKRNCLDAK